jgi:uncharacterized protein YbbC (DUF1343 family)
MSQQTQTGLMRLKNETSLQNLFSGKVAYLCHSASINQNYQHGLEDMIHIFGDRLIKIFGPQHGFVTDVQDNMVESNHYVHPYFKRTVYSLYSETRIPTDEMLEGIDHFFVDLQDVGNRIYTYIYTLTHLLEKCAEKNIEVIVLDRPNPINCVDMEGNILDVNFASFVGRHPMPVRHAMTIGEVGLMHQKYWAEKKANYRVIPMENYKRSMSFEDTKLPWVLPSPNLATIEAAYTFNTTVMYEGTNISEGRGTTRALEIIGHPKLEAFSFYHEHLKHVLKENNLQGFELRPLVLQPTFQKHAGVPCGGYQIHVTDRKLFTPWKLGQILMREFYHHLKSDFKWKEPPYEYVQDKMPIDVINGSDKIRQWIENNGNLSTLKKMEEGIPKFQEQLNSIKLYS